MDPCSFYLKELWYQSLSFPHLLSAGAAFTAADLVGIYMEPQLPFWGTMTAPGEEGHNDTEQSYLIEEGFQQDEVFQETTLPTV